MGGARMSHEMTDRLRAAIEDSAERAVVQRTEAFYARVEALSAVAFQLPIGQQAHDRLVSGAIAMIEQAEKDAYRQGMYAGASIALDLHTGARGRT